MTFQRGVGFILSSRRLKQMYKIGEFSRITSLTVKTLRYYDEAGILTPSSRDEESGYRLYSAEDYRRAELIILLRRFDFSISEIRDVLDNCDDKSDLRYYLGEKKAQIEKRINHYKGLMRAIDDFVSLPEQEEITMQYEIETKTYEPILVASIRFKGRYEETGKYFGMLYKVIQSKAAGAPFCCYYDGEYKEEGADIEVCVPVKEPVSGDGITAKKLPTVKAVVTTHIGPYDKLGEAYKAVTDYVTGHQLKSKVPGRETYLKGPGLLFKGNPNKYVTEVALEIE